MSRFCRYGNGEFGHSKEGRSKRRNFDEQLKVECSKIPSGRITLPREVASTIVFLLTDAASNIIGESIKNSGGVIV